MSLVNTCTIVPFFNVWYTTCSQQKMSQVLQVLDIPKIWIYHIFELFWMPNVTNTLRKRLKEHDGVVIEGSGYISNVK